MVPSRTGRICRFVVSLHDILQGTSLKQIFQRGPFLWYAGIQILCGEYSKYATSRYGCVLFLKIILMGV